MEDRYLKKSSTASRLLEDYKKHGSIIVAYDYDGTVHDYHGVGDTYPRVVGLLRKLRPYCKFIVYTCSPEERYSEIEAYLDKYDIPFDTINRNIVELNNNSNSKLYYNILLDDRAGLSDCVGVLEWFLKTVSSKHK